MQKIISTLTPELVMIAKGKYSIALAGSHAKEGADKLSDIDIFLFVEDVISPAKRLELIKKLSDTGKPYHFKKDVKSGPWGGNFDFIYNKIPIEITLVYQENMTSKRAYKLKERK